MRGDANLRLARVTKGNRVVAGLADDAVIRLQLQLLVQKLQGDPVAVFLPGGACAGIAVSKPTERELLAFAGEVEESIAATKAALNH